jgi:uncharacterized membrane protein
MGRKLPRSVYVFASETPLQKYPLAYWLLRSRLAANSSLMAEAFRCSGTRALKVLNFCLAVEKAR